MKILWPMLLIWMLTSGFPVAAYEHRDSLVDFVEYRDNVITQNKQHRKPYFLLFSAEWCHWCHEFAEHTLTRQDVADFLNREFVNVFIDTDIHNAAYVKYRATGLPYVVFLNPDGTLHYKYTGTLYGDDFLDVIEEVAGAVGRGKFALGMEANQLSYAPPEQLMTSELQMISEIFRQGILENFDVKEQGLGRGRKLILPRTFSYLIHNSGDKQAQYVEQISNTMERAVDRIFDPVEGGFFRYAEKRNWQIPHYEKFADLNAGSVLLLYQLNQISPSAGLKQAADKTLSYLTTTLFDARSRSFLSFQIADTRYYSLDEKQRVNVRPPKVMNKIFTDRLVMTLSYLIQVVEITRDPALSQQVTQSLDFLMAMDEVNNGLMRYYETTDKKWKLRGGLSDHAYVAKLFSDAATHYQDSDYADYTARVLIAAIDRYYDEKRGIFIDPSVDDSNNVEYLMEMNSLFALAIDGLGDRLKPGGPRIVNSIVRYFSKMSETLEERLWNAVEWEFAESYVPFLEIVNSTVQ
jgi:hypothetical protein